MAQEIWCPYMVGQVITVDGEADPNAYYQGTRWTRIAQGRVLAGIGTGTDSNNVTRTFTAGDNPGEYAHALTGVETGPHTHGIYIRGFTGFKSGNAITYASYNYTAGGTAGFGDDMTTAAGGGQAHNNVQPTYGVNYWRRDT